VSGRPFQPGHDPRRNAGRLPTSTTISRAIRRELGRDAAVIVEQIRTQAVAGDPDAMIAAAFLLGAVAEDSGSKQDGAVP